MAGSNALRNSDAIAGPPGGEADILSVPEACKFLRVHRNTLYKLIRDGELPAFRLMQGGRWRFRKRDLEQWLEDCQARRRL
jgi:excisionase family DNA binding protein